MESWTWSSKRESRISFKWYSLEFDNLFMRFYHNHWDCIIYYLEISPLETNRAVQIEFSSVSWKRFIWISAEKERLWINTFDRLNFKWNPGWEKSQFWCFRNSRIESTLLTPARNIQNPDDSQISDSNHESIVASLIWKTETWNQSNGIERYYLDGDQVESHEKQKALRRSCASL